MAADLTDHVWSLPELVEAALMTPEVPPRPLPSEMPVPVPMPVATRRRSSRTHVLPEQLFLPGLR